MMKNPHPARRRVYMLLGFFGAFLLLFFAVLYDAQVVHGSENRAKSITSNTASETVTASRGIITDRNGKVLVSNRLAYTLVFDKSAFSKDDGTLNDAIWRLIQLCQELDVPWNDTLPMTTGVIPQLKTAARSNAFQEYLKDNELPENASASELIGACGSCTPSMSAIPRRRRGSLPACAMSWTGAAAIPSPRTCPRS